MCSRMRRVLLLFLVLLLSTGLAFSQQAGSARAVARITQPINENRLVTLSGNTHPLARAQFDAGAVNDSMPMERMLLVLSRSPEQETALEKLLEDQQTPGSPQYRQWLTPEQFGQMYGPADADVQTVVNWLRGQGFSVNHVAAAKNVIEFSGTSGQVRQAFHTQIHQYRVEGKIRFANASDPEIPAALAPVVKGIASLNNFPRKPAAQLSGEFHRDLKTGEVIPDYTVYNGGNTPYYAIGPADFGTIYNTESLQQAGVTGQGRTIAVLGVTNIDLQDVTDFRNLFGLGAGNTSVVIDGPDPGNLKGGAEFEALLDTEWANAAAPGANVILVSAADTMTTSGTDLAAAHVIENNMADLISLSFGYCEQSLGSTENQFITNLWQQASAQGITVLVSTGDDGGAGCDNFNTATVAQSGLAVSGFASTPYNVAVGGTDFRYNGLASQYWSTNNATGSLLSAKSYIPETTWNLSCASSATAGNTSVCPAIPSSGPTPVNLNIVAASGGASNCSSTDAGGACHGTPKPAWQSGTGVPADGVRDIPDVALFSAVNSASNAFYLVCNADQMQGQPSCQNNGGNVYFVSAGGTSAATPAFAGILALAEQKTGTRLGNVNYLLYSLAAQPGSSCTSSSTEAASCIFNDVVTGNNAVPCAPGTPNCSATTGTATGVLVDGNGNPAYSTHAGYDLATGLGSVNGAHLVNAIVSAAAGFKPTTTTLALNGATTQVTAKHGDPISVAVNVSPTTATGSVALVGPSAGIDQNVLSGGLANWSSRLFPGGNYSVTAHYAGDGTRGASDSNGVPVSISPESSQTFVNLVTYDTNGNLISDTATTAAYGQGDILRINVGDAGATVSSTQGISSNCSNHVTSCPTGTVTVTSNGSPLDAGSFKLNSQGAAEDWAIQLVPGTYNVAASYAGDASYNASSGNTTLTVTKAPTTTTMNMPSTVPYGQQVSFGAIVRSSSNGTPMNAGINFILDGQPVTYGGDYGALTPEPQYRYLDFVTEYSFNSIGTHTFVAQYAGDSNYAASTSDPASFAVIPAATSLTVSASPNPGVPRAPVTLAASISDNANYGSASPSGTITFYDNGVSIGSVAAAGYFTASTLSYTFSQLGTHNITASYSGDTNYAASASTPYQLTIQNQIPSYLETFNVSLNPTLLNYPTQLQAIFGANQNNAPPLTGTVTFSDNGVPLVGTPSYTAGNGTYTATLSYPFTTTGTHTITATYAGDANYLASGTSAPIALSVASKLQPGVMAPTVSSLTGIPAVNVPITFFATVYPAPNGPALTGTITFLDNGAPMTGDVTVIASTNVLQTSMIATFTSTGTHNITIQYSGDTNYSSAASAQAYQLNVEGPVWIRLDNNQGTFSRSSGGSAFTFWVDNNTSAQDSITITCTSDSTKATCTPQTPNPTVGAHNDAYLWMNFTYPTTSGVLQHPPSLWTRTSGLMFCGVLMGAGLLDRRRRKLAFAAVALFLVIALVSCGGGGGGGSTGGGTGGGNGGTPPPPQAQTYHFTITATDGAGNTSSQIFTATVQ